MMLKTLSNRSIFKLTNQFKNHLVIAKISFIRIIAVVAALTVFALSGALTAGTAQAKGFAFVETTGSISVAELPKQGQKVYELIAQGGPFAYDKDGVVFGNREQLLPRQKRGYYREYTVKTSGIRHRGARRIVCGGLDVRLPDACYYTEDHYSSFKKIVR